MIKLKRPQEQRLLVSTHQTKPVFKFGREMNKKNTCMKELRALMGFLALYKAKK